MVNVLGKKGSLSIAMDLYGCPNRCLHCWLSHMPNRTMEQDADTRIVAMFKPYFDKIVFFSWLREPDYCPNYRLRWQRDKDISVNGMPGRFELASFWRLARDESYADFLKENGVDCVQLTFFGGEETTDRYVGRKGACQELLKATEVLLEHRISPRWQAFIDEKNKDEIVELLWLSEKLSLSKRCEAFGGHFKFFVHAGSCEGENRKLYPIRIVKDHIPEELVPYFLNYDSIKTERELYAAWKDDDSLVEYHNNDDFVVFVANNYDLYFNFTHMRPEWRIGNLLQDSDEELARRIKEEDIAALREARHVSLGELVRMHGDPASGKVFEENDYKAYLLNCHLEDLYEGKSLRHGKEEIIAILKEYGIGEAFFIKLIDASRSTTDVRLNYIIDRKYVLRLGNALEMTEKRMHELSRLVERYREFGLRCPAFIPRRNGKYLHSLDGMQCYLSEYIDLAIASDAKLGDREELGREVEESVAGFAERYRNIDLSDTYGMYSLFDLSPFDREIGIDEKEQNFRDLVKCLRNMNQLVLVDRLENRYNGIRSRLEKAYHNLPRCVFQGDENFSNVLVDENGRFAGLIDFNLAGTEVIVNQLANLAGFDYDEQQALPEGAARRMAHALNGYRAKVERMLGIYHATMQERQAMAWYAWIAMVAQWPNVMYFKYSLSHDMLRDEILALLSMIADLPESELMI